MEVVSDVECLKVVEHKARQFYRKQDRFHNETHGERVVAFARLINQSEQGGHFLVEAGAWLHQFHDQLGELRTLLMETGLPEAVRSQLYEIIRLCRPQLISPDAPLEARIVFDADAMDLMGAQGVVRELSCNLLERKLPYEQAVQSTRDTQLLFEKKLSTPAGQKMAARFTREARVFWNSYDRSIRMPKP